MSEPGMERKSVRLLEAKVEDDQGSFSGYGAIFGNDVNDEDLGGDVILKGAFTNTLKAWKKRGKFPPMLLQHGMGGGFFGGGGAEDLLPVGQWTDMREDDRGLPVRGKLFAMNTDKGQYIYEGLKSGVLDGLSIGYKAKRFKDGTRAGEPERTIIEADLWEASIVTFPMNTLARVTAVKNISFDQARRMEDVLRDEGLSARGSKRAVSVLRSILQRDAGAQIVSPRDEVPDEELSQLLELYNKGNAFLAREALRRG